MDTLGCDGCPAGWLVIRQSGRTLSWAVAPRFDEACEGDLPAWAFIDIPIGLADDANRGCDSAARAFLGKGFGSSVFPVPARAVLSAASYEEANRANRAVSGRGLSKQSFFILPKIREIDSVLQARPTWRGQLREAHPEVAFHAINGGALIAKKKTAEGFAERLALLQRINRTAPALVETILSATRRSDVGKDDVLDALCLALMPNTGTLQTLPAAPARDATGLTMEICYFA